MQTEETRKRALITGASRGIGRATAETFAQNGYDLVLTCHNSIQALEDLAQSLQSTYRISFSPLRELDVLVNNAGMAYFGLLADMTADQWHRILAVNLDSCFYACRAAIPLMLRKHAGSIVNVSSVWGAQGASMEVAYSASKGGMNAFTKALAKELAPSNIQVNAIACGVIDTAMNNALSPEDLDSLRQEIPADRLGRPGEVAELIFRTATAPTYMTGQIITIDGGWYS